ncbi:transmembrane 4 L6 family member 1-like [Lepisosteus oculatus]|uniref:transmembrane 4 L6 family member 1-like n=1 Tax=Lepisosteus oculatus TaxID=7918 RepID=UPI0035F515A2
MCLEQCARASLFPLAALSILANLLLYFPNGETRYASGNQLTNFVWFFGGIIGGGLLVIAPAWMLRGPEGRCCSAREGHVACAEGCPMLSSLVATLFGMTGSLYCLLVSALALTEGPYCISATGWDYPFANSSGRTTTPVPGASSTQPLCLQILDFTASPGLVLRSYLFNTTRWSSCKEPARIVVWNASLFSILLGLGATEFIIFFFQLLNTFLLGLCGTCAGCCRQSIGPEA